MKAKKIGIRDVAKFSCVSRQTVSRVLNEDSRVSTKTRKKVLSAIKKLNYIPDPLARSFATKRTYVLGIIARDLAYIPSQIIEGAIEGAKENDYQILICEYEHNRYGEPVRSTLLSRQHIEGILIVYQGSNRDRFEIFEGLNDDIPIVTIGYELKSENVTRILYQNRKAAHQASEHLIDLGHTKIAHITGPRYYYNCKERLLGYIDALKEARISQKDSLIVGGDWSVNSGYNATLELLNKRRDFTAVFTQNDWMAIGCLKALREKGLEVPHDVAVVGFDNIPVSKYLIPPLTTIDYPGFQLGKLCIKVLIERIKGNRLNVESLFPVDIKQTEPRLIVRDSCGANS